MPTNNNRSSDNIYTSYHNLRTMIGIMGIALPIGLWLLSWSSDFRDSISAYYYSSTVHHIGMHGVSIMITGQIYFVAIIITIGVFLLTYCDPKSLNTRVSSAAGIAAWLIVLFPVKDTDLQPSDLINWIHLAAAIALFSMLAINAFLFQEGNWRKTLRNLRNLSFWTAIAKNSFLNLNKIDRNLKRTGAEKENALVAKNELRDIVYVVCGFGIVMCLLVCATASLFDWKGTWIFWLEAIMIFFFGLSWFVKGKTWERICEKSAENLRSKASTLQKEETISKGARA